MLHPIQLIVGLGNPGKEYENTRHNAGAWFIEAIAKQIEAPLRREAKYQAMHGLATIHDQDCHLLVPITFMNHSGWSVQACVNYYKIPMHAVLIAHDEIDLPVGTVKLKFDGGDGGHNGLKDIIRCLNTRQFYRLRIGVGRPCQSNEVIDYVLNKPSRADREAIDAALVQAQQALPWILCGDMQKAMQQLHTTTRD
jgi:PTH1 family peptidyl-tRNA hydrolase